MSFILDALRKAESSRGMPAPQPVGAQLGEIAAPDRDDGRRRRALLAGTALMGVIAIAAVAWFSSGDAPEPVARAFEPPPTLPAPPTRARPAATGTREILPLDRVARQAEPPASAVTTPATPAPEPLSAPRNEGGTVTVAEAPLTPELVQPSASLPVALPPADVTPAAAAPAPAPAPRNEPREQLPGYQELVLSGRARLPELHLDIHVYADDPARRFVFVNNRKYREGEKLDEGGRVERITPYGAVVQHSGHRFELLPD